MSIQVKGDDSYYPSKLQELRSQIPEEWFVDSVIKYCDHVGISNADTVLKLYFVGIKFFTQDNDSCRLADLYSSRGRMFETIGAADSAARDFSLSKGYFHENCDSKIHYRLYLNWGLLYLNRDEFALCDSLFSISLKDAEEIGEPLLEIRLLNNIAISKAKQRKLAQAMLVFRSIYKIAKESDYKKQYVSAMNNIGAVHANLGNYDSAAYYFEMVLEEVDEDSYETRLDVYNNLAGIYRENNEYDNAYSTFNKALELATRIGQIEMQSVILSNYADFEYERGNGIKAYDFLSQHILLEDSLQSAEKMRAVKEIQEKYKTAERQREIADLEKKALKSSLDLEKERRNTYISVSIGILIVLIAIVLMSRLYIISNAKKAIQEAKRRSDDLLLNILPEDVAEELKETGESQARSFDDVTIMFADIADFTVQAQQLGPIELVKEINICFKAFDEIVTRHNVEKIKTIGDAYMAAAGFVDKDKTAAIRTANAALDMQKFMLDRKNDSDALLNFEMRVGLHTGPVVAGIVGVKKFQYDIWGDTVNTAARMESTCDRGRVNISEETKKLIENQPEFLITDRGNIEVKGKGEMKLYFVEYK